MGVGVNGNLIPANKDNAKTRGQKGGIAAGKKKKEQKTLQQLALWALEENLRPSLYNDEVRKYLHTRMTNAQAMLMTQLHKAISGDTYAAIYVRDTSGQKPSDKTEFTGSLSIESLTKKGIIGEDDY